MGFLLVFVYMLIWVKPPGRRHHKVATSTACAELKKVVQLTRNLRMKTK
jgi:hypothetical protein